VIYTARESPGAAYPLGRVRAADTEAQPDPAAKRGTAVGAGDGLHPARPKIDQSLNQARKIVRIANSLTTPFDHMALTSGYSRMTIFKAIG